MELLPGVVAPDMCNADAWAEKLEKPQICRTAFAGDTEWFSDFE
jgi:hypothetical protein